MPKQLNLFSAEELADCYLATMTVKEVRRQLKAIKDLEAKQKQEFNNVIPGPVKFVS